jgi:hypothetical protein
MGEGEPSPIRSRRPPGRVEHGLYDNCRTHKPPRPGEVATHKCNERKDFCSGYLRIPDCLTDKVLVG